jgi:basic membrane protein A
MTKSNVLGFVGGRENPLYTACSMAYAEGAKSVNPDIQVLSVFTGDFNDPVKAKEAAVSQIQSGADVIVGVQSLGMTGIFAAAEEAENQVWVVGKDNDQFSQAPNVVLTSVIIDYAIQMDSILAQVADGVRAGSMPQSPVNGAVYLADFYGRVPPDVVAEVNAVMEKVKNGEVTFTTQYDLQ